mgnify:CR=1 FL=1
MKALCTPATPLLKRVTGIKVKESTVQNPNLDPGTIGKKRIILDVHVKDEKGRFFFNLEMQTTYAGVAGNDAL